MELVINTFGAVLRRQGDRFLVRAGERQLAVSAHKVQGILVTTGVPLSTDALQLAAANNVDVVFLDKFGEPYGRFWQNRMGSTAAIRRRQFEAAEGPEGLDLVRGWVEAKLRNQLEFLEELARRRPGSEADFTSTQAGIRDCLNRLAGLSGDRYSLAVSGDEDAPSAAGTGRWGRARWTTSTTGWRRSTT